MAKSTRKKVARWLKQVAPIKGTASVSVAVEARVAAISAAAMLLGRSPFPASASRLVCIQFQVRPDHWHFEDLLFTFEHAAGDYQAAWTKAVRRAK